MLLSSVWFKSVLLSFIIYLHVVRTAEPLLVAGIMQENLPSEASTLYAHFRQFTKFLVLWIFELFKQKGTIFCWIIGLQLQHSSTTLADKHIFIDPIPVCWNTV